ncbi:MAG: A/G-specific adenine glycosylase [Elusimicrobia bacterium RBG_16_66_12]|nr:MAG: A/G-specific adenine glycosylase [Elusimicrobia bacterium RBG_16_66_12]
MLRWYRRARRDMPWRRRVSPYRTWVSEIMLQQTTVAAVTPKYSAFLRRFPDIRSLAVSSEDEVLRHWAGLGYYCRARNLRRAAQVVMAEHGGKFPSDFYSVLALPGVGRYTAGAILSIAFGKPYPVVDGNVIRVFSRLFGLKGRAKDPAFAKKIWARAEKIMPRRAPGDWNQALMELGATVCTPDSPSCGVCPVAKDCVAFKKGLQDRLPLPEKRREATPVRWVCLWIVRNGKVLIWRRSKEERLLKDLWGLPEAKQIVAVPGRRFASVKHTITHHDLSVELREAALENAARLPKDAKWVPVERARNYLVSSLWLKLISRRQQSESAGISS